MKIFFKSFLTLALIGFLFFWYIVKPKINVEPKHQFYGLQYGINQTTDFFDQAYADLNPDKPNDKIAGITVNHHLLAPNLIAKEFNLVATDKPITVLLVAPNHFFRGSGGVITSLYDWQTPYGVLETNQSVTNKLQQTGLVNIDETPFEQEHGINGIVGFIKKSLPNATFVPLIIKDNLADEKVDELALKLKEILPADTLVVGSIDFSHYLPSNGAEFHDIQSLAAINNFDFDIIDRLDIDSHPGLRLLLKYFDATGNKKFVLTSHENSSTVTGNYTFVETTSYINGYFTTGENPHDNHSIKLFFDGFGPNIASAAALNPQDEKYAYASSERLFKYNFVTVTGYKVDATTEKYFKLLGFNDFYRSPTIYELKDKLTAYGYVYENLKLTDVYYFPMAIDKGQLILRAQPKPDTMHIEIK